MRELPAQTLFSSSSLLRKWPRTFSTFSQEWLWLYDVGMFVRIKTSPLTKKIAVQIVESIYRPGKTPQQKIIQDLGWHSRFTDD